jgi:hypothetical protein
MNRDKKTDYEILPKKLAELFVLGTMALTHIDKTESLNKLIELAALDHQISDQEQLATFEQEVLEIYNEFTGTETTHPAPYSLEMLVLGGDSLEYTTSDSGYSSE